MIVKVTIPRADVEVIDKAAKSDGRSRSSFIARAALLAATKQAPSPKVERSCFTCRFCPERPFSTVCEPHKRGQDGVSNYVDKDSGIAWGDDGMPTNRTIDCPGWAAKEQG